MTALATGAARRRSVEISRQHPEKVGAAAARILDRRHGSRYFAWEYKAGQFRYYEHPVQFEREKHLHSN